MTSKFFDNRYLESIKPTLWSPFYYINNKLRKAYEHTAHKYLTQKSYYHLLDYGCGSKPYQYIFRSYCSRYVGIDVVNTSDADIIISADDKLPFNDNEFDIVLSSQVLEHVESPDFYLTECNRVLKKSGLLFLSTHGTWQYHSSPADFQRWTSYGLKKLIESHNFYIIDFIPVLGQLALTSQLRLNFYNSFANTLGHWGKILLTPVSILYQFKMMIEDLITPERVKQRDSAIYLTLSKKRF